MVECFAECLREVVCRVVLVEAVEEIESEAGLVEPAEKIVLLRWRCIVKRVGDREIGLVAERSEDLRFEARRSYALQVSPTETGVAECSRCRLDGASNELGEADESGEDRIPERAGVDCGADEGEDFLAFAIGGDDAGGAQENRR